MPIVQHQSKTDQHFTPPEIVEAARNTMGEINLDPASCEIANEKIVKADNFFDESVNGLSEDLTWNGKVFLNPPGGKIKNQSSQRIWLDRLIQEWASGTTESAIFVAFNLEIIRMRPYVLEFPHCIPKNRIRYWSIYDENKDEVREGQWAKSKGEWIWTNSPSHATIILFFPKIREDTNHWKQWDQNEINTFFDEFAFLGAISSGNHLIG